MKSNLLEIENAISGLQHSKNNIDLRRIERLLDKEFNKTFNITITDNKSGKFFGMNISPNNLDDILMDILQDNSNMKIINNNWKGCNTWNIEMDSILLYDKKLNASPAEILAILLHEIGHVVYSYRVISRATRVIKASLLTFDIKYRKLIKVPPFNKLLLFPLYEAITSVGYDTNNEEIFSDNFVSSNGYGEKLYGIINRLIVIEGSSNICKTEKDKEIETKILVHWAIENLASLEFRKDKLRKRLELEKDRTKSSVISKIISRIEKGIFGDNNKDSVSIEDVVKEQILLEYMTSVVMEKQKYIVDTLSKNNEKKLKNPISKKFSISNTGSPNIISIRGKTIGIKVPKKRLDKIEERDIDIIEADIMNMEYPDDKIFIIERIHNELDKIDMRLELLEYGYDDKVIQPKMKLESMRNRLSTMKNNVMNTRIEDKKYGLFLKYPEGYKG